QFTHNGDSSNRLPTRSDELSELDPLKECSVSAGGSLNLGDAEDQRV
ncbi:hypothetical protein XELAEV_180350732mg, partial [Xenopus laevis]